MKFTQKYIDIIRQHKTDDLRVLHEMKEDDFIRIHKRLNEIAADPNAHYPITYINCPSGGVYDIHRWTPEQIDTLPIECYIQCFVDKR